VPCSRITLSVPATSANLGPGFDALGCALDLRNTFTLSLAGEPTTRGGATGPEAAGLTFGPDNLVSVGFAMAWRLATGGEEVPPHTIEADVHIPQTRGLGSSSSALAAGAIAGWRLAGRDRLDDEWLASLVALEGHPDNLAPAVLGGLVAAAWDERRGDLLWARHEIADGLAAVLYIPDAHLSTEESRAALPRTIDHADAVYNLARTPLVVDALRRGDLGLLVRASEERLHERFRKGSVPLYENVRDVADAAGPLPCTLSGAGPTMLIWARADEAVEVAAALEDLVEREHVPARIDVRLPTPDGWLLVAEE
jgi:homoserine kinase